MKILMKLVKMIVMGSLIVLKIMSTMFTRTFEATYLISGANFAKTNAYL